MLAIIPKPVLAAIAAALLVALLLTGIVAVKRTLQLSALKVEFADAKRRGAEELARTESAYRKQESAWQAVVNERATDARKQLDAAQIDAAGASAAGDRLRVRLSQLAACNSTATAPASPASGSPPASATADLLADVQRRLDQAADGIARHADASHIAGKACEQSYDSTLKGPP